MGRTQERTAKGLMKFLSNGFEPNRIIQRNERNAMLQRNSIAVHFEKESVVRFAALILFAILLGSWFAPAIVTSNLHHAGSP